LKPIVILGAALLAAATIQPTNAQWVQYSLTTPQAPNCPPGYSWTKSGPRYQCMTPPPSCQYGFASGPAWTGSTWAYSCNSPPSQTPPPPPTQIPDPVSEALAVCVARAAQDGITLGPVTRQYSFDSSGGPALQTYHDTSVGPQWQDPISYQTGNSYMIVCNTLKSTGEFVPANNNPYYEGPNTAGCSGGCGGGV
jgi:hypothetical protein